MRENDVDGIKALLKFKANVNDTDSVGNTAFHLACANQNLDVVSALLPTANLHIKNHQGEKKTSFFI